MTPLDLSVQAPRSARAKILGYYLLPRTIDKLRAELPGGNMGSYLNHDTGFSAFVVRKLGLDMNAFRTAVADASDEAAIAAWLAAHGVDPAGADALNAKVESFVVSRMSPGDRVLVRERHPVMNDNPDLDSILDILDAEDRRAFVN